MTMALLNHQLWNIYRALTVSCLCSGLVAKAARALTHKASFNLIFVKNLSSVSWAPWNVRCHVLQDCMQFHQCKLDYKYTCLCILRAMDECFVFEFEERFNLACLPKDMKIKFPFGVFVKFC